LAGGTTIQVSFGSSPPATITLGNGSTLNPTTQGSVLTVSSGVTVWPGDADNNGTVNGLDFTKIFLYWGRTGPGRTNASNQWRAETCPAFWSTPEATYADCNGDGAINGLDFSVIFLNWGRSHPTTAPESLSERSSLFPSLSNRLSLKMVEATRDSITYQLRLEKGVVALNSIYLVLTYDPRLLALDTSFAQGGVQPTDFFQEATAITKQAPGRIELVLGLKGYGASGKGEIALIKFRPLGKINPATPLLKVNGSPVLTFMNGEKGTIEFTGEINE
jgi:hypothetical protein